MAYKIIKKQPKEKKWIHQEYYNEEVRPNKSILVYKDEGKYKVWEGNTKGKDVGKYHTFKTKKQAEKFAEKLIQ
jgi:hypothetical protein